MRNQILSIIAFSITLLDPSCAETPGFITLKEAYGATFDMGCSSPNANMSAEQLAIAKTNFTNITPESVMKPQPIEPREGDYHFEAADAFVLVAHAQGLKINGHCLVWHRQCPDWFFQDGDKAAGGDVVLNRMVAHIKAEVSHFKGRVFSWDVVNEALDQGTGYLRQTNWLKSIGPDYIVEAFRAAQEADPKAELYYNDFEIEEPGKRAKAIRLIRELKAHNVRIDGIGIQGHWLLDHIPYRDIDEAITAFHNEGVKVMITELDIDMVPRHTTGADTSVQETDQSDPLASGCPPEMLARQANQYAKLFALFLRHKGEIGRVTFWGIDDGHSWLNTWPRKRTNYPLLWDRQYQPKPAFQAVLSAAAQHF